MVGLRKRHLIAALQPDASQSLSATATLNAEAHANRPLYLTGDGSTLQAYTLPTATGSGNTYTFYVQTTNSGTYTITAPGTSELDGLAWQSDGNLNVAAASSWPALAGDNFKTLTLGDDLAELGSWATFKDIATDVYLVHAALVGSNNSPAEVFTT